MCKIMISVGEASGDLHGASVAAALQEMHPGVKLFGMGGRAMQAAGVDIIYDIAEYSVMGFVEVIKNLPKLFELRNNLSELMDRERPDVLVIIDYADFNMRLAKIAKKKGIPVVSYISPSVWVWRRGRAKDVAETVEKVAAIFPFEAEIYREAGANVTFVGHPLIDIVKTTMPKQEAYQYFGADSEKPMVLLLPGSRKQEISKLLPVMLEAAEKISEAVSDCQFYLPIASTISREILQDILEKYKVAVTLTDKNTYDLMNISNAAIAASGTVTLEAALLNLPTVVIYRVAALTYFLGKLVVKIPYVSLPNIIAGRKVVPELLQDAATAEHIANEMITMLTDKQAGLRLREDLTDVRQRLGAAGAVKRVAQEILAVAQRASGG